MKGHNQIIFCEKQMIDAIDYYLRNKFLHTHMTGFSVESVKKNNSEHVFLIEITGTDNEKKQGG